MAGRTPEEGMLAGRTPEEGMLAGRTPEEGERGWLPGPFPKCKEH